MIQRRPSLTEREFTSDREEYIVEMLFQLARLAAQDHDEELAGALEAVWTRFRQRAADRLVMLAKAAG